MMHAMIICEMRDFGGDTSQIDFQLEETGSALARDPIRSDPIRSEKFLSTKSEAGSLEGSRI